MPAGTFPDYVYTQAGIPATMRCPGGMKNRPWVGFTTQPAKEEATAEAGCAHLLIKTPIKISLWLVLFFLTHIADASTEVHWLQAAEACLGC